MAKIRMDYFTDPYCAWSWAFEPTLGAILASESDAVEVRYHYLPLIPHLAESGMTGPKVAAEWERIGKLTGMPIDARLWREHPPESTLAADRAVVAASSLGETAETRFLMAIRKLLMTEGRSADDADTLHEAARRAGIDPATFDQSLRSVDADERLRQDRFLADKYAITSTPAVILTNAVGDRIVIQGPRDEVLFKRAIEVLRVEAALESGSITATPLMPEAKVPVVRDTFEFDV